MRFNAALAWEGFSVQTKRVWGKTKGGGKRERV